MQKEKKWVIAFLCCMMLGFAGVMTFLIIKVMKLFMDIRVEKSEEADGLDVAEHGETAYPAFNGLD